MSVHRDFHSKRYLAPGPAFDISGGKHKNVKVNPIVFVRRRDGMIGDIPGNHPTRAGAPNDRPRQKDLIDDGNNIRTEKSKTETGEKPLDNPVQEASTFDFKGLLPFFIIGAVAFVVIKIARV